MTYCNAVYNQNTTEIWTNRCILPFSKKGHLGIAKNYHSSILPLLPERPLLLNRIEHETEKSLRKNQNGLRKNRSLTSQILTIRRILGVRAKNSEATLLFVDFS